MPRSPSSMGSTSLSAGSAPRNGSRPRKVTMKDVADRAGVSPSTVSFVLAQRTDMRISEETRQRVLRSARELGYRPNLISRSFRTNVTRTVGLISDTIIADQYGGEMIEGSLRSALDLNHLLVVCETEGDTAIEAKLIDELLGRQVDGVIYASLYTRRVVVPRALASHPLVLLNCVAPRRRIPAIVPDELAAGRCAADSLLRAGHRTDIYIVGSRPPHVLAARERSEGMQNALAAAGVRLRGAVDCDWWPEPAYEAVARLLRAGKRPSALICMNDRIAFGAYQALQEVGIPIPEEISVVSFDDSPLASWLRPQLTSIGLPHAQMGRRAVETLLSQQPPVGVQRITMPVRERASIGPARGAGNGRARP